MWGVPPKLFLNNSRRGKEIFFPAGGGENVYLFNKKGSVGGLQKRGGDIHFFFLNLGGVPSYSNPPNFFMGGKILGGVI